MRTIRKVAGGAVAAARLRRRGLPWKTVLLVLAVGYILSPIDFIPDFLPLIGWADDLLVALAIVANLLGRLRSIRKQTSG